MLERMAFNDPGRKFEFSPVYEAPLAYGVDCDWGTLSVTEGADEALGFAPQAEINHEFATFGDRIRSPYDAPVPPAVHVLLADQVQLPGQQEQSMGKLSTSSSLHPNSIHVVLGVGSVRDQLDISVGMQLAEDAESFGLEDTDDLRLIDPFGQPVSAAEARRHMVESATVNLIANAAATMVEESWVVWQRNNSNGELLKRLRNVGLVAGGAALLLETAGIATHDVVDRPGILLAVLGGAAYFGLRNYMKGSTGREMHWRSTAPQLGYHVGHTIAHALYAPPEPPGRTIDA